MPWELPLQVIQTIAVVLGIVFGLLQLHQLYTQREAQAGIELLQPLQAPDTAEALMLVHSLPDNLSGEELKRRLGPHFGAVIGVLALSRAWGRWWRAAMCRSRCIPSSIAA